MAAVVLRAVVGSLRLDCGQRGSFTVSAVNLQFTAVLLNRIRVKWNNRVKLEASSHIRGAIAAKAPSSQH